MLKNIHFGDKIRVLRDRQVITNEELAVMLKFTVSNLFHLYKREHISTDILIKCCDIFGVPPSYFFEGQYNMIEKTGSINAVGEKFVSYGQAQFSKSQAVNDRQTDNVLTERLESCEREKKLLREMIELLKNK